MQYLGIGWGTRRASWCAIDESGNLREGSIPAEQDGLSRLTLTLGAGDVCGCIEMMSGAVWVRDQLALVGWDIGLADARKVKQSRHWHARPIASTHAWWPTWPAATLCPRSGSRHSMNAPTASDCAGARI